MQLRHFSLPGYEAYATIMISYYIPDGVQTKEHPRPGIRFTGASRVAYLPNNREGQQALRVNMAFLHSMAVDSLSIHLECLLRRL